MFVKSTSESGNWRVYHRGCSTNKGLLLNDTGAETTSAIYWFGDEVNVISPTSTQFTVNAGFTNIDGATYVAYLFAHNAGGFGTSGADNVISCGSFTTDGSGNATVSLGYEPQWVMIKNITRGTTDWHISDNMRGMPTPGQGKDLRPNLTSAETETTLPNPTATGFTVSAVVDFGGADTYIYIAISRGPIRLPTDATKVFTPITLTGNDTDNRQVSSGFVTDFVIGNRRTGAFGANGAFVDRLRGPTPILYSYATDAEATGNVGVRSFAVQDGMTVGGSTAYSFNYSGQTYVNWMFRRAPSFFDVVCYTGTGVTFTAVTHNLQVVPELFFIKRRSASADWTVCDASLGLVLNTTAANVGSSLGLITSTSFEVQNLATIGASGSTYVAYLFATCAGVSKVGSYTGTATTLQVDCGFTGGARFVLIKRTDSTGDWYVWDTARGIIAGNDPYLLMNSTAAEVTNTDYIDSYSPGFELSSTAPDAINASGGTYIFLAIA
jgi:hypothetical protein